MLQNQLETLSRVRSYQKKYNAFPSLIFAQRSYDTVAAFLGKEKLCHKTDTSNTLLLLKQATLLRQANVIYLLNR